MSKHGRYGSGNTGNCVKENNSVTGFGRLCMLHVVIATPWIRRIHCRLDASIVTKQLFHVTVSVGAPSEPSGGSSRLIILHASASTTVPPLPVNAN